MKLSCAESSRVLDIVRLEKGPTDWGNVLLAIIAAGFATEHQDVLVDAVSERMLATESEPAPPAAKTSRTSTQNFETWTSFVPQAVWTAASEGSMDELFDHLAKLGLRHPSEQTSAVMSLAILHSTDGYERAQAMSPETRIQFLKTVKFAFKYRSKRWPAPESYVSTLPATPHDFANQFPSMHAVAFADGEPVASPISAAEMLTLRATTSMRGNRGTKPAPTLQLGSPSSSSISSADLFAFGQGLMMMMNGQNGQNGQSQPRPLMLKCEPKQPLSLTLPMKLQPSASPALRPEAKEAEPEADADLAVKPSDVDKVAADIARALEATAGQGKKAKSPKAKGKATAKAGKAKATDASKGVAKAKAASKSVSKAKPSKAADFKSPPMPKLQKAPPIFLGTCTIYTDVGRKQWRACEASNRRKDVKFHWKDGALTKDQWQKCVQWCSDNTK